MCRGGKVGGEVCALRFGGCYERYAALMSVECGLFQIVLLQCSGLAGIGVLLFVGRFVWIDWKVAVGKQSMLAALMRWQSASSTSHSASAASHNNCGKNRENVTVTWVSSRRLARIGSAKGATSRGVSPRACKESASTDALTVAPATTR